MEKAGYAVRPLVAFSFLVLIISVIINLALDDALSVRKLSEDTFEVGVHVCDMTHYIVPHSAMDKEARARGVRVDLQPKFVPMLPTELTDQVTNLDPGKKKYVFFVS